MSEKLTDAQAARLRIMIEQPDPKLLRKLSAAIFDRAIKRGDMIDPNLRMSFTNDAAAVLTKLRELAKLEPAQQGDQLSRSAQLLSDALSPYLERSGIDSEGVSPSEGRSEPPQRGEPLRIALRALRRGGGGA